MPPTSSASGGEPPDAASGRSALAVGQATRRGVVLPFTPQRSPPSLSPGRPSPPLDDLSGMSAPALERQEDGTAAALQTTRRAAPPAFLAGWTYHQSFEQTTVLFYVPAPLADGAEGTEEDVQVTFGDDYLIAGLRGCEPVFKAKLAGHINRFTSTWQLEPRARSRRRLRERDRVSFPSSSLDDDGNSVSSSSEHYRHMNVRRQPTVRTSEANSSSSSGSGSGSVSSYDLIQPLGASSLRTGHSRWHAGLHEPSASSPNSFNLSSSVSFSDVTTDSSVGITYNQSHVPSPASLSPVSTPVSFRNDGERGRSASASSFERQQQSEAQSRENRGATREASEEGPHVYARLVSIYLDKLQPGIWHQLVVGPAPLLDDESERQRSEAELSAALQDALCSPHEDLRRATAEEDANDSSRLTRSRTRARADTSAAESVATTIGSDDSETILGFRPPLQVPTAMSMEQTAMTTQDAGDDPAAGHPRQAEEHARYKYNMDAQSLALIGQQAALRPPTQLSGHSRQNSSSPSSPIEPVSATPEEEAFEYFKRAWEKADVPLAITKLVDYVPLPISAIISPTPSDEAASASARASQNSAASSPADRSIPPSVPAASSREAKTHCSAGSAARRQRQKYVFALGGNAQLAQLYVAYARLHLSSSWSPLAFPSGSLNNPFVTRSQRQDYGFFGAVAAGTSHSPPVSLSQASSVASSNYERASSPDAIHASGTSSNGNGNSTGGNGNGSGCMHRVSSALHQHVGPLPFLKEAVRLDPDVYIDPEDWEEAAALGETALAQAAADAEARKAFLDAALARDASSPRLSQRSLSGGSEPWGEASRLERRRRKESTRREPRRRRRGARDPDQGDVVVNFVSSAALLSVCLAGSVAAFSWWRRVNANTQN
ncbi:hypothetical protein K437DRAFT_257270 [Tilletiaria anomala UBC 951]|uniref:CS domain-containing protein n=1 Tax=Tilletiaria anomala (strain ATCC 24038 / CBS 436.72 / UBC 951) TaxID=1037660 RepID=A0A066VZL0_TILAU|nr:uncharacterized protein K437DRAFT_257270 [Tilletiaria anomala UBC 951]KDN43965.1 hypothetical protein K437DRAFT_257270 [Tilletiaria anomala UBC 951]